LPSPDVFIGVYLYFKFNEMKLEPKRIITALQGLVKEYNFTPEEVYSVVKM